LSCVGWFGVGLSFLCFCPCGGCIPGAGRAFAGVVVDIPASSLEAKGGSGHGANELALALGTNAERLIAELLDLLEFIAASGAAILIEWQGIPPGKWLPSQYFRAKQRTDASMG
jgi:hypothetical protein